MTVADRVFRAPRARRWLQAAAAAATLAAAAGSAHAGDVRWSIGLNLPLPPLPGVIVRQAPVYAPPPVVYAPRPYADVYGPSYGPAYGPGYEPGYGPEVVAYDPYPRYRDHRYVQPRVFVRPVPVHRHWDRVADRHDGRHDRRDHGRGWDRDDRRGDRGDRGWDRGRH